MIIIGIDPGYDRLGIAILEKPIRGKEVLLYSECFQTSAKDTIYERLLALGEQIKKILAKWKPDAMAIETLFIDRNQKTGMRVSEARGIIIYEALLAGLPISEYSPMDIKMAVAGDGTSDKSRIIKMVQLLIDITTATDEKKKDDEYDAIAVALTHSARVR